ncbi:MAG: permease [Firmicutes bacterium]|nr:permease [Bacillota bacterium]
MNVLMVLKGLTVIGMIWSAFVIVKGIKGQLATAEGKAEWDSQKKHGLYNGIVGIVAYFFDTLGIGSYAIASSAFKLRKSVKDEYIPGTLNVGAAIPVLLEAFLFFGFVEVDILTLVLMVAAQVLGANLGAGIVTKWDAHKIRLGMGVGLLCLGIIMAVRSLGIGPFGAVGTALGLSGVKLIIAVIVCVALGAFMNIGIGAYAPTMALVAILGMNVGAAFPIMMGGCAFLLAFGNVPKFVKEKKYDMVASCYTAILGTIGVLIAYFLVKSLPLDILMWLVIVVVLYTSILFLRDAIKKN